MDASSNNLAENLPDLPGLLETLNVADNHLEALPPLPHRLEVMNVSHNCLTTLPELPDSLEVLNLRGNTITMLPERLPPGLRVLDIRDNPMELPPLASLPSSLQWLNGQRVSRSLSEFGANNPPMDFDDIGHLQANDTSGYPLLYGESAQLLTSEETANASQWLADPYGSVLGGASARQIALQPSTFGESIALANPSADLYGYYQPDQRAYSTSLSREVDSRPQGGQDCVEDDESSMDVDVDT